MELQVFDAEAVKANDKDAVEMLINVNKAMASIIIAMVETSQRIMNVQPGEPVLFASSPKVDDYFIQLEGVIHEYTKETGVRVTLIPVGQTH